VPGQDNAWHTKSAPLAKLLHTCVHGRIRGKESLAFCRFQGKFQEFFPQEVQRGFSRYEDKIPRTLKKRHNQRQNRAVSQIQDAFPAGIPNVPIILMEIGKERMNKERTRPSLFILLFLSHQRNASRGVSFALSMADGHVPVA